MRTALLLIALTACESKVDNAIDKLEDKVKNNTVVQKVDKGLDNLDRDEAATHLAKAKEMVGKGEDPAEACSWVDRATGVAAAGRAGTNAATDNVKELAKLCQLDVPLARATRAVAAAEKAKAEQPSAPSFTECSSDDWAAMKTKLEGGSFASDSRWGDLKARWAKVCPDAK